MQANKYVFSEEALDALCAGCAQILSRDELIAKLREGRPLRVKLGVDPTAPDIHLGHTVALTKLRQFQDYGHEAILIIGDFTAMIGDPSGRSATRPHLTRDAVLANAKTYQEQAFKVLDPTRTKVVFNGDWFRKMTYEEAIALNSRVTLQQMLHREDFRTRMEQNHAVRAHELQYPIMQGWDSVVIQADIELGGTDQLFNIMVGRDLQREEGLPQQVAMLLPILEGTDGVQKMSKSLGNAIGVAEPPGDLFGKVMSIPDEIMAKYYQLLLNQKMDPSRHPMENKQNLARDLVTKFYSSEAAEVAIEDFRTRFSKRDLASADLPEFSLPSERLDIVSIVALAYEQCFKQKRTRSEIRRLIEQGSVRWENEKIPSVQSVFEPTTRGVLKLDKTRAVRVVV